ncbi:MAG: ABC transporter substrate-binding protein, partial [Boseongicola sp.]|nr:ABC transporter substrate-binding protein [Boseongicola sp.]
MTTLGWRSGLQAWIAALTLALAAPLAATAEVNNPGLLVHAADDEPTTLDPAQVEPGEGGETVILQVYDRLLDVGPASPDLIPSLAAVVPSLENGGISGDGMTYTFKLREGVTFHDGTAFTADDVKFSWDRAMTMDLPEGNAGALSDVVASTAVIDDMTFRATLSEPSASFLNSAVVSMVASIVSQDAVEANGGVEAGVPNAFMAGNMVGTGPYKFVAWNRNENIQLEVNDDYWGENAKLDVRIEIGGDPDVRVLGLRAGEFDTIETDPSFIADLEGADGVTIFTGGLLLEPLHIGFNLNIPEGSLPSEDTIPVDFFHDPRIRQAFNHAFDYEAFLNGPLAGYGAFNPHYTPIGVFGHDSNAPVYSRQNYAEAERLFREAGVWDEGFSVSVITEEGNLFALMCLVLKDSIERLNPKFRINVLAVAESVFDDAHAQNPLEYAMWAKNADPAADPNFYMQAYQHP